MCALHVVNCLLALCPLNLSCLSSGFSAHKCVLRCSTLVDKTADFHIKVFTRSLISKQVDVIRSGIVWNRIKYLAGHADCIVEEVVKYNSLKRVRHLLNSTAICRCRRCVRQRCRSRVYGGFRCKIRNSNSTRTSRAKPCLRDTTNALDNWVNVCSTKDGYIAKVFGATYASKCNSHDKSLLKYVSLIFLNKPAARSWCL